MERTHPEVDVLQPAILSPRVSHQLQDFEELGEVQVLLGGDDVDHLVEPVGLVSFFGGTDISGDVDRRSVYKQTNKKRLTSNR